MQNRATVLDSIFKKREKKMKKEKRFKNYEIREAGNKIEGYVMKYQPSDVGGMLEKFEPDSIEIDPNTRMLFNHSEDNLLGKMGANLEFKNDKEGLKYSVELPDTALAKDVKELVRKEVISGASLGFVPIKERYEGGMRIIEKAKMDEVSLVSNPAYDSSTAEVRSKSQNSDNYNKLRLAKLLIGA